MPDINLFNKIVYGIERCPQCGVAKPLINLIGNPDKHFKDSWDRTYYHFTGVCSKCRRHVLFYGHGDPEREIEVEKTFPSFTKVAEELPPMAAKFLKQAVDSKHAPDGALMLSASSIDAMLKAIGYSKGTLYARIDEAKSKRDITDAMAEWAHSIRLSANEPRHADEEFTGATEEDALQSLEFAKALGEYLFVLPLKVSKWKAKAEGVGAEPLG